MAFVTMAHDKVWNPTSNRYLMAVVFQDGDTLIQPIYEYPNVVECEDYERRRIQHLQEHYVGATVVADCVPINKW